MAVVTEREKQILMQMGFAEFIIPAMSQTLADRKIGEFLEDGVPPGTVPGQPGTTAGGGILDQLGAGVEGFVGNLRERVPDLPEIRDFTELIVLGLIAIAVIVVLK